MKEDPVRLELSYPCLREGTHHCGAGRIIDLVAGVTGKGRIPRDLQGTWDWTVRHGQVSTVAGLI